jgi:hypothetical protein
VLSAVSETPYSLISHFFVAAAKVLAKDPDPAATKALADAAGDKSWPVRAAALEALAKRGDPSVLDTVQLHLSDGKDTVKYTAARPQSCGSRRLRNQIARLWKGRSSKIQRRKKVAAMNSPRGVRESSQPWLKQGLLQEHWCAGIRSIIAISVR